MDRIAWGSGVSSGVSIRTILRMSIVMATLATRA